MNENDNGRKNAAAWGESIKEMVACLECDRDRLEELKEERDAILAERDDTSAAAATRALAQKALEKWDAENAEELAELTAASMIDGSAMTEDEARQYIQESVLSVEVRSGWYTPGADKDDTAPEEFRILLTTGGPACRIMGELNDFREPCRAWIEYQDWGTGWQELHGDDAPSQEETLAFARCFYFGE